MVVKVRASTGWNRKSFLPTRLPTGASGSMSTTQKPLVSFSFAEVDSLKAAGVDHEGVFTHHLVFVDMAEGNVVVGG